jgi:hypothetical protein
MGLGGALPKISWLHCRQKKARKECELQMRRAQLTEAYEARVKFAVEEIRQAVLAVGARGRTIAACREKAASLRSKKAKLQERMGADGVTYFDLVAAEQEILQAESAVVQETAAWKIAFAQLRQAQGLLAWQCGHSLPAEPCCQSRLQPARAMAQRFANPTTEPRSAANPHVPNATGGGAFEWLR